MARGEIYPRKTKSRKEKPIVLIVPEGTVTEKAYFMHFNSREKPVKVEIIENTGRGAKTDYASLVEKALKYKTKNLLSASKGDSVWIVADGDVDYNTPGALEKKQKALEKARAAAEANDAVILISNPCFELWYYLHGDYSTAFMKDYQAVKEKLLSFLPDYDKNRDVYDLLYDRTDAAVERAKRLESFHLENGEDKPFKLTVNPYTEIYRLVEKIK